MTLSSNYNADDILSGNNNSDMNNIKFCTVAATSNSQRSLCSNISVMVEDNLKWKTIIIPGGTSTSAVILPRRDFHFKQWCSGEGKKYQNFNYKSAENVTDTELFLVVLSN
ncbi:hypothetical protein DINM_005297 [Dirofilaria immitis]|nr:hypothetical protein [Dirofilaria immitis]